MPAVAIDLTGSDDETPPSSSTHTHYAPPSSGNGPIPNIKRVKPSPSKKNADLSTSARMNARTSFSQSSASKRPQTNGDKSSASADSSSSNEKQQELRAASPKASNSRPSLSQSRTRSPKRNRQPIVLRDDSHLDNATLSIARALDTSMSQLSQDLSRTFDELPGATTSGQKRPRSADEKSGQDSPRKRTKVASSQTVDAATNRTKTLLADAHKGSLERSRPLVNRKATTNVVDLTLSPPRTTFSQSRIAQSHSRDKAAIQQLFADTQGFDLQSNGQRRGIESTGNNISKAASRSTLGQATKSIFDAHRSQSTNFGGVPHNFYSQNLEGQIIGTPPSSSMPSSVHNTDYVKAIPPKSVGSRRSAGEHDINSTERSSQRHPKQTEKAKELGINRDRSTSANQRPRTPSKKPSRPPEVITEPPTSLNTRATRGRPGSVEKRTIPDVTEDEISSRAKTVPRGFLRGHESSLVKNSSVERPHTNVASTNAPTPDSSSHRNIDTGTSVDAPRRGVHDESRAEKRQEIHKEAACRADKGPSGHQAPPLQQTETTPSEAHANLLDDDESPFTAEADLQLRMEANQGNDDSTMDKPVGSVVMASASSLWSQMPLERRVEKVLGQYLEEMREDNEYWTGHYLELARLSKERAVPATFPQPMKATSFAQLRPLKLIPRQKKDHLGEKEQIWRFEMMGPDNKGAGFNIVSIGYTSFKTDILDVPNYAHYVSIKQNILAPNVVNLHCWPYFGDEADGFHQDIEKQYHLDIAMREEKLLLLLQAQTYEPYVESTLFDIGCSWADVLRYLIEERPKAAQLPNGKLISQQQLKDDQRRMRQDNFSPTSSRSIAILSALPSSSAERLKKVGILCTNFEQKARFDIWHIARRSKYAIPTATSDSSDDEEDIDCAKTCRFCFRFNCPYHGELNEQHTDDSDVDSLEVAIATDIVHPPKVNYRTRMAFPVGLPDRTIQAVDFRAQATKRDVSYWRHESLNQLPDRRGPFYPCYHPGKTCEEEGCSCYEEKIPCEKTCSCMATCERRFQGCSCAKKTQKCYNDDECVCFAFHRECDPDLCGACGVCEVVDPVNRHDDEVLRGKCRNGNIQRGVAKQTLLGDSGVHGFGLYACEDIHENDFVGEYKGEIITKQEAERRGAVYEHQNLSYLFSLNTTQEIDSTFFGNQVRFINHAGGSKANLYARVIMVNAVHRIALYAARNIKPGQELLFDYGPQFPNEQLGGTKKSNKSAPHVRNANLVRGFAEVEESEDEVGNLRAKAADRSAVGAPRVKAKSQRGRPKVGQRAVLSVQSQKEQDESAREMQQDAGQRLATFNVSDDPFHDPTEADQVNDAYEDDGDEYQEDDDDSDGSEESDGIEEEVEDKEDEDDGDTRTSRRRKGIRARNTVRL